MDPSTPIQGRVRSSRYITTNTPNPRDDQMARCQKAALELLLQKHKNAREAGDANDCVEWRQVTYWANKWKKDGTMNNLAKATRVIEQDAARDISARKRKKQEENASDRKLEYGQDRHWPAYTEAYNQAGHLVRNGLTPGKAALQVPGQFGVKMSRQTAIQASSTVDKSPPRKGPDTTYKNKKINIHYKVHIVLTFPTAHCISNAGDKALFSDSRLLDLMPQTNPAAAAAAGSIIQADASAAKTLCGRGSGRV